MEAFRRFYRFHLDLKAHPGSVYSLLPAIAEAYNLDEAERAWLAWVNGNTQNPVTSLLLLEAAKQGNGVASAVDFWSSRYEDLEWDTDRRYQKKSFGTATYGVSGQITPDLFRGSWTEVWKRVSALPTMGRLSSWSMIEFARILLGPDVPDAETLLLDDRSGSRSHRNGLAIVDGYDAAFWGRDDAHLLGVVEDLEDLGETLLDGVRGYHPDVSRLSLESALCTYKSWHKPNRRYPNVYSDLTYRRIRRAEERFRGFNPFDVLWEARKRDLPKWARLEDSPNDPGAVPVKQNHYRETGEIPMLGRWDREVEISTFDENVDRGAYGPRKD